MGVLEPFDESEEFGGLAGEHGAVDNLNPSLVAHIFK